MADRDSGFQQGPGRCSSTELADQYSTPGNGLPGILVVDDTVQVRVLLKVFLQRRGFRVWLAGDGREAISLYQQARAEIAIVLLDVRMPDLDGPQTLMELQKINPHVCACFMTGNAGAYSDEQLQRMRPAGIFCKPFVLQEVADLLLQMARSAGREVIPASSLSPVVVCAGIAESGPVTCDAPQGVL